MKLDDLVAIDVHTHAWKSALQVEDAPDEKQEAMGRYFRYQPQHTTVPEMAEMYRKLKMAFVVFTVDSPKEPRKITNEEIAELAHKHADVAIPFASGNPHRGAAGARLAKRLIKDYSVKGFKFHPSVQEFSPNDRMAYPLYEAIAEAKLPALFHTGQTGVGAGTRGGGGIRLKYSNPMLVDDVAADFPDMPIVLAHPSFPWQEEALSVATHKPQVYIDLSGWSPKYFPPILIQYANTLLKDKILFGSDYPVMSPERWMADFDKLDIKPEVRPLILKENAAKLLGLRQSVRGTLVEEELHFAEELQAVFLHQHAVRALADDDEPLRIGVDQLRKERLRHVGRRVGVPLGEDEHRRHTDVRRIVERLAGRPVFARVEHHAVRRAHEARIALGADRVARERRAHPFVGPGVGHRLLTLRDPGRLALERGLDRDLPVGAERRAGIGQRFRFAQPDRGVQHQAVHLGVVLRRIEGGDRRTPGPAEDVQLRHAPALEDEVDRRAVIARRGVGAHDRRVTLGRLVHLGRARRFSVAAYVDEIDVIAAARDVVHPGQAVELQVEGGLGRIRGTVDEEDDVVGAEPAGAARMLVAHVELHAWIGARNHEFFRSEGLGPARARG